jgi:hypothetical protein
MSLAADPCNTLIRELLEWIGPSPRPYAETLEAWSTSCPRLPVWEEANDRGLVVRHRAPVRPTLGEAPLRSTSGPVRGGREAAWF